MEGLCPCGHEPTDSIVPVSELVSYSSSVAVAITIRQSTIIVILCTIVCIRISFYLLHTVLCLQQINITITITTTSICV